MKIYRYQITTNVGTGPVKEIEALNIIHMMNQTRDQLTYAVSVDIKFGGYEEEVPVCASHMEVDYDTDN